MKMKKHTVSFSDLPGQGILSGLNGHIPVAVFLSMMFAFLMGCGPQKVVQQEPPLYGAYPAAFHPNEIQRKVELIAGKYTGDNLTLALSPLSQELLVNAFELAAERLALPVYAEISARIAAMETTLEDPVLNERQKMQLKTYRMLVPYSIEDARHLVDPLLMYHGAHRGYPDSLVRALTRNVVAHRHGILTELQQAREGGVPDYLTAMTFLYNCTWGINQPVGMLWLDYYRVSTIRSFLAAFDLIDNQGNIFGAESEPLVDAAFILSGAEAHRLSVDMSFPAPYTMTERYLTDLETQNQLIANMPAPDKETSLLLMRRSTEAQLSNLFRGHPDDPQNPDRGWNRGTFAAGVVAAWTATRDPWYLELALDLAETANWEPGHQAMYDANDLAIAQSFLELYEQGHPDARIEATRKYLDSLISQYDPNKLEWSWCDALFMAPPTWARMGAVTGEWKYFDHMAKLWWQTSDLIYDTEDHLFFRDLTYVVKEDGFQLREINGEKIFWGRGNGWVIGALPRVIQYLPADYPGRPRFEQMFKEMCAALLRTQQQTGLWPVALLDEPSYPMGDTSIGTFACYAFAWGVNHGLLDPAVYTPAALKAWRALSACIDPDTGLMGYVQLPGDSRLSPIFRTTNNEYATGAYLLAGSEIMQLL